MGKYLKLFESHTQYETFIGGGGDTPFIRPNVSHCIAENHVHYNPKTMADEYLTFVALEDGTFTFTPSNDNVISYSLDSGKTWTELEANTNTPTVVNGNKILWKGEMTPSDDNGIGTFGSTAHFDVQGNMMSLLYGDNFEGQTDLTGKDGVFSNIFGMYNNETQEPYNACMVVNTDKLVLPATTLTTRCYQWMFVGCTSLTTTPVLPAATLEESCYYGMFEGCTSLVNAPELPATTLVSNCYSYMFKNCTSLTTAPELPAMTMTNFCYLSMFEGCTSLVNAPELPATTLAFYCYTGMFRNCTSLTTAPELPATTLASTCYGGMFQGCSNLNYIKAMFTTKPSTNYTSNWVNGVASTGTFVKNTAASWDVSGVNGIPSGWTVETATE